VELDFPQAQHRPVSRVDQVDEGTEACPLGGERSVLEGRVGLQLGAEELEAGPGDLVFKPRHIPHTFWNAGDEPARLLELISPAGFEHYFRELAPLLAAPERDQAAIGEVVARYQLDIDFATIPTLAERHDLRLG
jgi:hypothetical protein